MNLSKVFLAISCIILLCTSQAFAQGAHSCPSDQLNDSLLIHDTQFSRSFFYMEQRLAEVQALPAEERSNVLYTLPVVVHVIHEGEPYGTSSNITDEQVISAIDALNEDFRRMLGTNGYGNGADVEIEFCLAQRDPNGQPSTGIVRVNGSSVPLYADQGIESSGGGGAVEESVKALSTWPRTSYINIWVVNEIDDNNAGNGVQGYAYFPINNPIDGIVILHNAFGTVGNLKTNTNMNRTLTHEIGHYLGLYHTFHDTSACGPETNCSTAGDRICDTPVTIQNSSCTSPACSGTQQVQNYMDYTPQTCQDMFSEGQKLRMRTTLETQRTTMLSSMGCMPVFTRDAGITYVQNPTGTICAGSVLPQVTLANFGSATLTSVTINYNIDGVGSTTQSWTGSLVSGAQTTITLNAINPSAGAHTLYVWTTNPNAQSDQNTSNDQATGAFTVSSGAAAQLVVTLDYFGGETTWNITDASNVALVSGGPYQNNAQGTQITEAVCLSPGCYTLNFFDAYGDGQGFTSGNYVLRNSNNVVLASATGNWGDVSSNNFCLEGTPPPTGTAPVASFTVQDNTICKNVQIDFTSTSTNTPTSYSWTFAGGTPATSTVQNPQNITWATPGYYNVTLTASNAYGSNTYVCSNCITVYADPTSALTGTNPSCNGGSNGNITNVVSGASPFNYAWSNGATTQNISNVPAGAYSVTVTSAQGCSIQQSATLNSPAAMNITGSTTNPSCSGANTGSITATATGGTGSKTYAWNNGATGATASSLAAGTYTVTATDANGCTKTQSFTLTAAGTMSVTGTVTNPLCNIGNTGSITATAAGGTGNKTYAWSNGATGATANNLAAGTYTVTATDAAGCTATQSFTLAAPSVMTISGTTTNPLCNTGNTGSITVSTTGGTGSKTYTWSNGATGATASNLAAGNYTVTATDANGCTKTQSFTLNAPGTMTISGTTTNPLCNTGNTGSITVSATGGTGSKTYTWSNGAIGATAGNLAAGSYTVTATDANGCTKTQSFTLTAPGALQSGLVDNDIPCSAQFGSAQVTPSGGTAPYSVVWSTSATGNSVSNLSAGSYSVIVTDANGCSVSNNYVITQTASLNVNINAANVSCFGGNNGSAIAAATGGNNVYSYVWSNGATTASINSLQPGQYSVIVTDGSGCQGSDDITISQPQELALALFKQDISCFGLNDGTANVTATGGVSPYDYEWNNGGTASNISNCNEGTYSVLVTDSNGCTEQASVVVVEPSLMVANTVILDGESCFGNDGSAVVNVMGGSPGYFIVWNDGTISQTLSQAAAGDYFVSITDVNGCALTANVTIPFDCKTSVPTTQLIDTDCGAVNLPLNGFITCEQVPNASMFMWRFLSTSGVVISDEYSLGNSFMISQIPGVTQGMHYKVAIKALVNNVYGAFGALCDFGLAGNEPASTTSLSDEDCDAVIVEWGQTLEATVVPGAMTYQWHITGNNYDWTTYTDANVLTISENMSLQPNEVYSVQIRCAMGQGVFTEWGAICQFTMGIATGIDDSAIPEYLLIYPNPNGGENIFFDFSNLPEGSIVQDLTIYGTNGNLVEKFNTTLNPESQKIIEYRFAQKLAAGMYVMHYKLNDKEAEIKLIVR
jgi:PKD repeat protein